LLCASKGLLMPALPSSAFFTKSASICWAATLFGDSGTGLAVPGRRPYHLPDFFFTLRAPGVPAGTLRAFTNRAPGAPSAQTLPSKPTQTLCSQYWIMVILKRLAIGKDPFSEAAGRRLRF
jgi:hypothetical protein